MISKIERGPEEQALSLDYTGGATGLRWRATGELVSYAGLADRRLATEEPGSEGARRLTGLLLEISEELERRRAVADRDGRGLPLISELEWSMHAPTVGGLGDIPPFHRKHVWKDEIEASSHEVPGAAGRVTGGAGQRLLARRQDARRRPARIALVDTECQPATPRPPLSQDRIDAGAHRPDERHDRRI